MVRNGASDEPAALSEPVVETCRTVTTGPFVDLSSRGRGSAEGDSPSDKVGARGSGSLLRLLRERRHVTPVDEEALEQGAPPHEDDAGEHEHSGDEVPEGEADEERSDAEQEGQAGRRQREGEPVAQLAPGGIGEADRKSTRLNSSHVRISYAVFC